MAGYGIVSSRKRCIKGHADDYGIKYVEQPKNEYAQSKSFHCVVVLSGINIAIFLKSKGGKRFDFEGDSIALNT